jgi:hypothetical protein
MIAGLPLLGERGEEFHPSRCFVTPLPKRPRKPGSPVGMPRFELHIAFGIKMDYIGLQTVDLGGSYPEDPFLGFNSVVSLPKIQVSLQERYLALVLGPDHSIFADHFDWLRDIDGRKDQFGILSAGGKTTTYVTYN